MRSGGIDCYASSGVRAWLLVAAFMMAGCKPGGKYVDSPRQGGADRGEVNGRSFDFVSTKPDGDEWTIRFRGNSMWVAYSFDDKSDDLGAFDLDSREIRRLWELVDDLKIPRRKPGRIDDEAGTVLLRLREPGGEGGHKVYTVYVSRDTNDDRVIDIADYLRTVVKRHTKEKPNF